MNLSRETTILSQTANNCRRGCNPPVLIIRDGQLSPLALLKFIFLCDSIIRQASQPTDDFSPVFTLPQFCSVDLRDGRGAVNHY